MDETPLTVLAESENYAVLVGSDPEGEDLYNIEFPTLTLHLFREELVELIELLQEAQENL